MVRDIKTFIEGARYATRPQRHDYYIRMYLNVKEYTYTAIIIHDGGFLGYSRAGFFAYAWLTKIIVLQSFW